MDAFWSNDNEKMRRRTQARRIDILIKPSLRT